MKKKPLISIIMGSKSDWPTMEHAALILKEFKIPHEIKVISAHRTPKRMNDFSNKAEKRGIKIIIAGAGGAAHLPGMTASQTKIPVLGVPIKSKQLDGIDSLLSIAQMPKGIPVGTLAIGEAGAANAALLAISILGLNDKTISSKYEKWRIKQTQSILLKP
ncbi:5-(carboxyamino)imidazole ribonucleotide mutase [Pelagibacterales bacterium]|jgi:5-(carboxyamino)imidazole ribonucleotide mutase|nr:5-(carboxyamino)imidazole ribonucleotide mutase [Pelagibacterales bacterium]MDA7764126.1 5-(carboxyamino)imidazole ribonucleotide mutase [Pelagibacterales bacterium]|tara:strand:+ start:3666 stop:4148 length:483 start_codon:yes stop_codon:yes gene_type:complete